MTSASESMKAKWADPEWREQALAARRSLEARDRNAEAQRRRWADPEYKRRMMLSRRTAAPVFISKQGYRVLRWQHGHPLAGANGELLEHRKALHDVLGDAPHPCHWCGKVLASWRGAHGIHADHLDGDRLNNDPDNLVASCKKCNGDRGKGVVI